MILLSLLVPIAHAITDYDWYTYNKNFLRQGNTTSDTYPVVNDILWTFNCTGSYYQLANVLCVDDIVYSIGINTTTIHSIYNKTYAIYLLNGTEKWNASTGGSDDGATYYENETGKYLFIQICGFLNPDEKKLICLNASTGSFIWNFSTPPGYNGSSGEEDGGNPVVIEEENLVITNGCGVVYAVNMTTGTEVWNRTIGKTGWADSAVTYLNSSDGNKYVYVCSDDNLTCFNASTGKVIWYNKTVAPLFVSPMIANETVFIGDTNFYAFNATKGNLLFKKILLATMTSSASYDSVTNSILFGCDGKFYCINATTGDTIWLLLLSSYSTPAISNGYVYFASESTEKLYCYNITTGTEVWNINIINIGFGYGAMTIYKNILLFCASNYNLYAIGSINDQIKVTGDIITVNVLSTLESVIGIIFMFITISLLLGLIVYFKLKGA